ncbi:LamB/YcsF family protein [Halomonas sp. AOP42-B2-16]|uniref:LamB/YcsF family protein n=1 Tax=Halomonas sp. AOP42-B2-16 TaxID=3457673 RepID=UPI00403478FF
MTDKVIDLNSDLGEGYGAWRMADDGAMLEIVSSANIACGAHAGDPVVMADTLALALTHGVAPGAHIGYPDRQGFGRRLMHLELRELELLTLTQLGALAALAESLGTRLTHANFHGALGNLSFVDRDVARVLIGAVRSFDPDLAFVGLPHTAAADEAERQGLRLVRSFLADRAYHPDGTLASRKVPGSVIHSADEVKTRISRVLTEGTVLAIDGTLVKMPVDSILIHSDTAGAIELAQLIRRTVEQIGFTVAPLSTTA